MPTQANGTLSTSSTGGEEGAMIYIWKHKDLSAEPERTWKVVVEAGNLICTLKVLITHGPGSALIIDAYRSKAASSTPSDQINSQSACASHQGHEFGFFLQLKPTRSIGVFLKKNQTRALYTARFTILHRCDG